MVREPKFRDQKLIIHRYFDTEWSFEYILTYCQSFWLLISIRIMFLLCHLYSRQNMWSIIGWAKVSATRIKLSTGALRTGFLIRLICRNTAFSVLAKCFSTCCRAKPRNVFRQTNRPVSDSWNAQHSIYSTRNYCTDSQNLEHVSAINVLILYNIQ